MATKRKTTVKTVQRVIIYTRVSEARDAAARAGNADGETSTARQHERCKAYAEAQGWSVVGHHTDRGISAFSGVERPGWVKVLGDVKAERTDAVLVFALDRAGRNTAALLKDVETMKEQGVAFVSATQPIDTSSVYGGIILAVLAAVAEMESAIKRERALSKVAEKVANGEWTGAMKGFGYTVDMEVIPTEAKAIRSGAAMLLNGSSLKTVAYEWNEAGLRTTNGNAWIPNTVKERFRSPTIAGLREFDGELHPGRWDAILTRTDWDRLQVIFDGRRTGRRHDKFLLTGLAACGLCGGMLVGRGGRYICKETGSVHLTIDQPALDAYMTEWADRVHLDTPETVTDLSDVAPELRERIAEVEALLDAQADQLAEGVPAAIVAKAARKLEAERAGLLVAIEKSANRYARLFAVEEGANDLRDALESYVEHLTVNPAPSTRSSAADRVEITWRDGVEPNESAADLARLRQRPSA